MSGGFLHDSGYIGIVARNLVEGRGFVNDAHWLLFLNPEQLPMPFHNANPGYPTATALVMLLTGSDPARAMLVVSILGAALMAIGAWGIARRATTNAWLAVAAGAIAILFPANWRLSLAALPDALATGLLLCLFAVLLHARLARHWVAAGVLFGLAWLVRSTATVAVPAVALWSLARHGLMPSVRRGLILGAAALVVVSPWLVHTAKVRGSPLASDAGYYLLLRYHATQSGRSEDQYYRSLQPPPTTSSAVKADAAGVLRSAVTGLPIVLYRIGAGLAEWEKGIALLMVLALAMGTVRLVRAPWRPELAGAAVVWLVLVGTLAIRGDSIEIRYFSLGSTLLAMLLVVPLAPASARARWLALPLVAYLALGVVPQDLGMLRYMTGPNADHATMRSAMQASVEGAPEGARVISPVPYFFTFWTRRGAISPPYPGKAELVEVMRRYNAPIVLLPTDSLDYYYPGGPDALRPEVQLDRSIDRFTLLRRTPN